MQMSPAWSGFMLRGKGSDKDAKEILPCPPPRPAHRPAPPGFLKGLKKKMQSLGPHSPREVHGGAGERLGSQKESELCV